MTKARRRTLLRLSIAVLVALLGGSPIASQPPQEPAPSAPPTGEPQPGGTQPGEPRPQPRAAGASASATQTGPAAADGPVELPAPTYRIEIEASYNPESRLLTGVETLRWRNTTATPVEHLEFHLYLNAFAHNRTTLVTERPSWEDDLEPDGWGWIEVTAMRTADGSDLKRVEQLVSPDDGNPYDRTVARYPLPEPLAPGAWITLEIEFEARMPAVIARTGADGDFVMGAQWYPKIGVFEAAGLRNRRAAGWNTHQFHARSEFYADFGDYDVTLTLPRRYAGKIGATGTLASETVEGDRVTARFVQPGVHDFAWTAYPAYRVLDDRFDPREEVSPEELAAASRRLGVAPSSLRLEPVELRLLTLPGNLPQAGRYFAAARAALELLGLELGRYPYPVLTLVDPPNRGAGGMEYPTLVTLGTAPLLAYPPFDRILLPEVVTVHEIAHQYFQGMVANNEFEEAWLDEGLTSYYEQRIQAAAYGPFDIQLLGFRLGRDRLRRAGLGARPYFDDPIDLPTWAHRTDSSWASNSYGRTAVTLQHLENLVGESAMGRAMRSYFQRYRFRHPSKEDFQRALEESLGRDLGWFFRQAISSTRRLDYAVVRLRNRDLPEPAGHRAEEAHSPVEGAWAGQGYRSTVEVVRIGEFRHPITAEVRFADGRTVERQWDGESRWIRWTFTSPDRIVSASIDPERKLALEANRLNDSRTDKADRWPTRAVVARIAFWLQNLLQAASLFA